MSDSSSLDAKKQAPQKLIDSVATMKVPVAIPKIEFKTYAASVPVSVVPQEKKLLAVKVWQEITYLVRCVPGDDVGQVVADPMNRIARVGEGKIEAKHLIEVQDATSKDLEAATPTKALVI